MNHVRILRKKWHLKRPPTDYQLLDIAALSCHGKYIALNCARRYDGGADGGFILAADEKGTIGFNRVHRVKLDGSVIGSFGTWHFIITDVLPIHIVSVKTFLNYSVEVDPNPIIGLWIANSDI